MKKYFIFRLKDNLKLIILLSVIGLICTYAFTSGTYVSKFPISTTHELVKMPKNNPIEIISYIALVLSIIIPLVEFRYRMRKLTVDQLYSLPIKREKIFLTHYLVGFIEIMIPVTISFLYSLLSLASSEHYFDFKYYFIYYFTLYLSVFIIYSFITFMFMRANSVRDGIFNVIFGSCFFICFFYLVETSAQDDSIFRKIDSLCAHSFNPLFTLCDYFQVNMEWAQLEVNRKIGYLSNNPVPTISLQEKLWIVFNSIVAIASFVLSFILVQKDKSEDSMGISNSWFSYKTMIPFYVFFFSCIAVYSSVIVYVFILLGGYIMYVIYRRNIKIKLCDIGIMFASLFIGVFLGLMII